MNDPHVQQVEAFVAQLRERLLAAHHFETSELRPHVVAGYQQDAPGGPRFADHAAPVTVVTIAISTLSDEEHRRQLALPPNPRHQRASGPGAAPDRSPFERALDESQSKTLERIEAATTERVP